MAMDLDALKRDLNVVVGSREDAEFYYFPAQDAVTYLQWAFCTAKPVAECCDREKLVRMVIPMFEEEAARIERLIAVLNKYAAGDV